MKFPKRVPQHISESASFKLLSYNIPGKWIIREITEKDYGIDCYIEIVGEENELTGALAMIQLKSRNLIKWSDDDKFNLTGIKVSTSNYWWRFPVPVFIFLADMTNHSIYFLSVKDHIRRNFSEYCTQKKFSYKMEKKYSIQRNKHTGRFYFEYLYLQENFRLQFENELLFFLSNFENMKDFQNLHDNLDFHLGLEDNDLVYFEAMHRNFQFLCSYFQINNQIPELSILKDKSLERFKDGFYELYEYDLIQYMDEFKRILIKIKSKIKILFINEKSYWEIMNLTLFRYINDLE
ncbi:DUF4365 domain-containing protein [Pedobacter arcticus]|uniref:DUF4365 domain-containing protein n=1 Tax=Pedobacter arcticus TaxID=752140 RepID=UPI0002F0C3BD|nr:DUF4365 domain-containing protein [Pedobacter arcticus]